MTIRRVVGPAVGFRRRGLEPAKLTRHLIWGNNGRAPEIWLGDTFAPYATTADPAELSRGIEASASATAATNSTRPMMPITVTPQTTGSCAT